MKEMKFKIGDKVKALIAIDRIPCGTIGVVVERGYRPNTRFGETIIQCDQSLLALVDDTTTRTDISSFSDDELQDLEEKISEERERRRTSANDGITHLMAEINACIHHADEIDEDAMKSYLLKWREKILQAERTKT